MAFGADIQALLDAWVGTAHRDYDSRVVFVARVRPLSLVTKDFEDLWVASRTFGTSSTDTPANQPMAATLIPPNVKVSVWKGDGFVYSAPITVGDLRVINPRMAKHLDPTSRSGMYDHWATGYDFRERVIDAYVGPLVDASDGSPSGFDGVFEAYFRGNIKEVLFKLNEIVFRVSPQGANWRLPIQQNFYGAGFDVLTVIADEVDGVWTNIRGDKGRRLVWAHDSLLGIKKPICLGEVFGMMPQRVSLGDDVHQWDTHPENEGLVEVYEGGLGSADGGPAYTEDDEVYGVGLFKLDAGTPDKPLTFSAKGGKFMGKQLVTQSHDLTHSDWTTFNVSVTGSKTDPLGNTEAAEINDASASAGILSSKSIALELDRQKSATWVGSCWLKEGTAAKSTVSVWTDGTVTDENHWVEVQWSTRTISTESTSGIGTITHDDGTWLRLEVEAVRSTAIDDLNNLQLYIYPASYVAANTGTVFAFAPQLECITDQPGQSGAGLYRRNETSTALRYIDRPMLLVEHLLVNFHGYTPASLDWASFARWDLVTDVSAGVFVSHDQDLTFEDVYKRLLAPKAFLFPQRDSTLAVGLIEEPYDPDSAPDTILGMDDIGDFDEKRIPPCYRVMVGYRPIQKKLSDNQFLGAATGEGKSLHSEKTRWAVAEDQGVFEAFKDAREVRIETNLASRADAQALADEQLLVLRQERRHITITQRKKFYRTSISERVSVGLDRYGYIDDGNILFGDGAVIGFDDDESVEKENPAAGLPGIQVGQIDNPSSESSRARIEVWV